jgi:hypothetical protein
MAKRSYNVDKSERVKVSDEETKTNKAPETVRIVLLRNLKLNYTGPVTEKLYVFERGGTVLDVDKRDAEIMLAKRGGQCCPGGSGPQPYFAEV